jgi:hypothetical protein
MPLDWVALTHYVPEIILVVIFMFYEERRKREQDQQDRMRDQTWRDFLVEERNERHRSADQLTNVLGSLVTGVNGNHELIVKHDEWERQQLARRRDADWQQGRESE